MFERFSESAWRTVFLAVYEAARTGSAYIESKHLLSGLLLEDAGLTAASINQPYQIPPLDWPETEPVMPPGDTGRPFVPADAAERLREALSEVESLQGRNSTAADMPLSKGAQTVLRSASQCDEGWVALPNLLYGLVHAGDARLQQLLEENGLGRNWTEKLVQKYRSETRTERRLSNR